MAASLHGHQCRRQGRWMISYPQVRRSFPFHKRKFCVTLYFCLINPFYLTVTVTLFMNLCPRLSNKHKHCKGCCILFILPISIYWFDVRGYLITTTVYCKESLKKSFSYTVEFHLKYSFSKHLKNFK
jgi:hypothetical protein